ncbi:MAG: DUF2461 family protein, partial [Candidatus Paceibacterota bacterium]
MPHKILTAAQATQIRERAEDVTRWRDEADQERRRQIALQLQKVVKDSGVLDGKTLDHRQLSELVGLQWQVQNLNPIQMPNFLGLYAYKVHFAGFQGTVADLAAQREEQTGERGFHEGADLEEVSESIRLMASESREAQGRGAALLFDMKGAGEALVSGFMHLLHPDEYALVNSPTRAPFTKDGWLNVSDRQRREAREKAEASFPSDEQFSGRIMRRLFRWQMFLSEVFELCGFRDYHELDQFLWILATEPASDADDRLKQAVAAADRPNDLAVRREAEAKARELIESNLGRLSADHLSELFTLLNACVGKKGTVYTRFGPAFVGHNKNLLIEQADQLNGWIETLWTAKEEDVPNILSGFWEEKLAGGGRSFPTAVLYLRDKEKHAVWTSNLEKALYTVIPGLPAKFRTGFSYLQFCKGVDRLRKKQPFPPEMHDFVLFMLTKYVPEPEDESSGDFSGFSKDTFAFMEELSQNNTTEWFDENRPRYQEAV